MVGCSRKCAVSAPHKGHFKIQHRINNGAFQSLVGLPGSAFCYSFKEWTTCDYALPLDNGDSPGLVTSLIKAFGLLIRLTHRERGKGGVSACYGSVRKTVPAYTSGNSAGIHQWKQCRYTPGADTSARIPQVEIMPAYPRWRQWHPTPGGNSGSIPQVETVAAYPRWRQWQHTPGGDSGTLPQVETVAAYPRWKQWQHTPDGNSASILQVAIIRASSEGAS